MNKKLKKSVITLMIFLVLIISITAISASDNDSISEQLAAADDIEIGQTLETSTEDINSDILEADNADSNQPLETQAENEILTDGNKTFSDLNDEITNNTEVDLKSDYVYSENDTAFKGGIAINKNVTINGNGHKIDSTDSAQLFTVGTDCKLTLNNVILLTDYVITSSATSKGNIINKGEIIFNNVTFTLKIK